MSQTWFIKTQSGKSGPYTLEDLQFFADKEKIKPNSAICRGSNADWVKAKRVRGLHFTGEPTSGDHEEPSVMPDSSSMSSAEPFGISRLPTDADRDQAAEKNGQSKPSVSEDSERETILAQREKESARRESDLSSRESELSKRELDFSTREAELAKRDEILGQRELEVADRESQCAERNADVANRESDSSQRDSELSRRETDCAKRESELAERESDFAARDGKLSARAAEAADRDADYNRRETELAEREEKCSQREQELAQRDAESAQRESDIANRETAASGRESELAARETEASDRESILTQREADNAQREAELRQGESTAIQRESELDEREVDLQAQQAKLNKLTDSVQQQQSELEVAERELKQREAECQAKEHAFDEQKDDLAKRENECDALEMDLRTREADVASRVSDVEQRESEANHRENELRRREAQFLAREADFAQRLGTGTAFPPESHAPGAPTSVPQLSMPQQHPGDDVIPASTDPASGLTSVEPDSSQIRKVAVLPPRRDQAAASDSEISEELPETSNLDSQVPSETKVELSESTDSVALRQAEYNRRFGPPQQVAHDPQSKIYVSIHPPSGDRHYTTLVTNGLSDYNMSKLKGSQSRAELIMYVQDVDPLYTEILESLAHVAEQRNMSFGYGVTINNGNPPHPIMEHCVLNAFVFMIPMIESDFRIKDTVSIEGEPLQMLWVTPITSAERDVIRRSGMDQFLELLEKYDHPLIFDPTRKCYAKRKWFKRS